MKTVLKLSALVCICISLVVLGACKGGGSKDKGGDETGTSSSTETSTNTESQINTATGTSFVEPT